jgi:choline kinase
VQLVVLAAGKGARLGKVAQEQPKSLVTIAGTPYLALQMQAFARFPFTHKFIVGGYAIQSLEAFLQAPGRTDWTLVNNPDFHKGNLYSLSAVLPQVTDGFFIFNADHYYSPATYARIFAAKPDDLTVFCDRDRKLTDDDMKVASFDSQLVTMAKTLAAFDCGYVGITWIPKKDLDLYRDTVAAVARDLGETANVEAVMSRLAADGEKVAIADISGSWWTEIDTPLDLANARAVITQEMGKNG